RLCVCSHFFFFSSRRRHTRSKRDWSSDVCSSDLYILALFKRRELETTLTELNAIAAPATHGASNPIAAIGIPAVLYPKAQKRFRSEERRVGKEWKYMSASG